jgi:hypothetical protein
MLLYSLPKSLYNLFCFFKRGEEVKLQFKLKEDDQLLVIGLIVLFLIGLVFMLMDMKVSVFSYDEAKETNNIKSQILQRLENVEQELQEVNKLLDKLALIENATSS